MSNYQVPQIAFWFHYFPHFFPTSPTVSNSSFIPQYEPYFRYLIVLAFLPFVFLVIVLLFFLCYCLIRCSSDINLPRKKNLKPMKIMLGIFVLIISLSVGMGFYGNSNADEGMQDGLQSLQMIGDVVTSINSRGGTVHDLIDKNITISLNDLSNVFSKLPNATLVKFLKKIMAKVTSNIEDIDDKMVTIDNATNKLNISNLHNTFKDIEYDRWSATIGCLCFAILVLFLVLCGLIKTSSCLLKMSCFLGVFLLIFCWVGIGFYLALSVALGDFCVDPNNFLLEQSQSKFHKSVVRYYTTCDKETESPFSQDIKDCQKDASESYDYINHTFVKVGEQFPRLSIYNDSQKLLGALNRTSKALDQILALLDCSVINKNYNNGLNYFCINMFYGEAYILLSYLISVTFLIVLIVLSSKVWVHFIRNRRTYVEIDSDDPFLPRNSANEYYGSLGHKAEGSRQRNSIYSDFLIATNSVGDQASGSGYRQSPPPAYDIFDPSANPSIRAHKGDRVFH